MGAANKEARRSENPVVEMIGKLLDKTSTRGIGNTPADQLIINKPSQKPSATSTTEFGSTLGSPQEKSEFLKATGYKMNE